MPSLLKKCFNMFYKCIIDTIKAKGDGDLIRNCAFALGICAQVEPKLFKPKVKEVLKIFNGLIDNTSDQGAKDNIISALFKITAFNHEAVPYKTLSPTLYSNIPLTEDLDENEAVSKC